MNRRVTTLLATLGVALGGLVVTASPAAAYTTTIGPLDTSTPGHVRGTVTTDAPYVVVRVLSSDYWQVADTDQGTAAGTFDFDLETWGLDTGLLAIETCASEGTACTGGPEVPPFEASDVVPEVEWPPSEPFTGDDLTIAVSDSGGGYLWAQAASGDGVLVPGDGSPTVIPAPHDGSQHVYLNRCSEVVFACNGLVDRVVTIDRPISADAFLPEPWTTSPATINVDDLPSLRSYVTVRGTGVSPTAHELAVHRTILNAEGNPVGTGTTALFDLPLDDQTLEFYVGLDHLKSGQYTLRVETSWGSEPTQRVTEEFPLAITNPAPVINAITRTPTSVYPAQDGYLDSTVLTLTPATWRDSDSARFEIRNSGGTVIRALNPTTSTSWDGYKATWNGRTSSGAVVPTGTYTVTGHLTDRSGTTSQKDTTVTVVRKHLANLTWTRTVTPAASYIRRYVGSCSTLRKPSLRGWSGSFGLYSNTKCRNGFNASWSESHHAITVAKPANLRRYLDVRISEYGGAAKARPTSTQRMAYLSTAKDWRATTTLSAGLGTHHGLIRPASSFIQDRGTTTPWLYWAAFVSDGRRYDVKSFTVRVRYEALVND